MLRLTNLADYAVVVLVQAAQSADQRLSASSVAAATGLPIPTVAKVTGQLARAGLVTAQRGSGGGFRLARAAGAISVADIIEAMDGPIALTHCIDGGLACSIEKSCQVKAPWQVINRVLKDSLASVSLADLAGPAALSPVTAHEELHRDA